MRSTMAVTTATTLTKFVDLDRVKRELAITDDSTDDILGDKIDEASADIQAALGFRVPIETVTETFWHGPDETWINPGQIILQRTPVTALNSVTLDGDVVDSALYRLDDIGGLLYALDSQGYPWFWNFWQKLEIAYQGGFVLPGGDGDNPVLAREAWTAIQSATLELVSDFWSARGRDPSVKAEETFGVDRVEYWVGTVGDPGELPPRVLMKLNRFRRVLV